MAKVGKTTSPSQVASSTPSEGKGAPKAASSNPPAKTSDDAFTKAMGGLLSYKSSRLFSGAMKILSESGELLPDKVLFPPHLTDPNDPRNSPKYLRLLAAIFGLDELESYFYSLEGKKQEEYLERKSKQREATLEKKAKEKEEKEEKRKKKGKET
jgi:hypothetical protein